MCAYNNYALIFSFTMKYVKNSMKDLLWNNPQLLPTHILYIYTYSHQVNYEFCIIFKVYLMGMLGQSVRKRKIFHMLLQVRSGSPSAITAINCTSNINAAHWDAKHILSIRNRNKIFYNMFCIRHFIFPKRGSSTGNGSFSTIMSEAL